MKLFLRLILIGALTYFLSLFLPWWILVVVSFVVGWLIPGSGLNAFTSGFLGVGIVWMSYAWKLDVANNSLFSSKMLALLPVSDNVVLLALVGLIGGFCGGFAALTGSLIRQPKAAQKSGSYYQ